MEQRREGGRRGATGGRMTDHAGAALGQPRGGGGGRRRRARDRPRRRGAQPTTAARRPANEGGVVEQ
jgi:hypothetical protein